MKLLSLLLLPFFLAGCFNDANNINLGSVSIGQQLIDLKLALDSESIDQEEYTQLKGLILSLSAACVGSDDYQRVEEHAVSASQG